MQTYDEIVEEYNKGIFLKAVDVDGAIIGSVRVYATDGTGYIGKLIVCPTRQGRGVGTALMQAIERECSTVRFELFTSDKSVKNIRLYERLGYVRYSEKKIADSLTFIYMEKYAINMNVLHTTKLGEQRIRRNLDLDTDDVVGWCKRAILTAGADAITRKGKNWYVRGDSFILTINAGSHTIITAHKYSRD